MTVKLMIAKFFNKILCSLLLRFTDDTFDPDIGATIGKYWSGSCTVPSLGAVYQGNSCVFAKGLAQPPLC